MRNPIGDLRGVLRANAATSGLCGLVCVAAAAPLADVVAGGRTGVVRLVGAGLVLFALDVALLARVEGRRLATAASVLAAVDLAWAAAMVALVVAGVPEAVGAVLALATGVVTAALAGLEWTGAEAERRSATVARTAGAAA